MKMASLIMSCLPVCFVVSLLVYFYWAQDFLATRSPGEVSRGIGVVSQTTHWMATATIYSLLPNLIIMILLFGYSWVEKKPVHTHLIAYIAGVVILLGFIIFDRSGALYWYLD